MKVNLNREFEERYLLVLSDEEKLYESIVGITKEFMEGKIPSELYIKSLDIANATVQEIHSKRDTLHKLIKQIRYHLFKMKEYIEINYEDGLHFTVIPNPTYTKLHDEFLTNSNYFLKEWNKYEKEHGLCLPDTRTEIRSFELVFRMIDLIMDEYNAHRYPNQELIHIYMLTRELPGLLIQARDLSSGMNPRISANRYYSRKYMGKPEFTRLSSLEPCDYFHQDFEFKQARANGYPDFEYVREPGFRSGFENSFGMERRRHIDLVPSSRAHQQMTGDIGQIQSNQFNETKHFKSRLFEAGLGLHAYPPIKRHPLQETGQMGETSDNINPYPQPHYHPESHSEVSSATTPPGPKLERPNTRGDDYPNYTFGQPKIGNEFGRIPYSEQPTMENEAKRKARSGSGQPVYPGHPELRQEPSEETTRKS